MQSPTPTPANLLPTTAVALAYDPPTKPRHTRGRLTTPASAAHNVNAFDASEAGRGNPIELLGAQRQPVGAFFVPAASSWLLVRGRVIPGRFPSSRFSTPAPAATNPPWKADVSAPIIILGATQ